MNSSKISIIVTHPSLEHSVVNKRWIDELDKFPDKYVVHDLHALYPDGKIDVKKEQEIVENFQNIVFQFPYFWFNCPPLLKQWLDEVLIYGWAFGSKATINCVERKLRWRSAPE